MAVQPVLVSGRERIAEGAGLLAGGELAGQVEGDAAEEGFVVGERRGDGLGAEGALEGGVEAAIDYLAGEVAP